MARSSPTIRNPGCFLMDWPAVGDCDGRLQDHHLVKQQAIRRRWRTLNAAFRRGMGPRPWALGKALGDRRLQIRVCKRHHDMLESRELHLSHDSLAYWAQQAVDEYGLEAEGGLLGDYAPPA